MYNYLVWQGKRTPTLSIGGDGGNEMKDLG